MCFQEKVSRKIVYIGAGSFRFTVPCALNILDFAKSFHPIDLWLVDIDYHSLAIITHLMKLMVRYQKKDVNIHATLDRKRALLDADYVLISISVGIQQSEWIDIHLPLKFGIPQNTGDTVGPGGIFRGLRTIPPLVDIIMDIKTICPQAIVLNYTNPQATLMLAAKQVATNVQSIGLCHEFFYLGSRRFARYLKLCGIINDETKIFRVLYGGINHFSWVTKFEYDGKDIYPQLRENAHSASESGKFGRPFSYYLLNELNYFCYVADRHVVEFLPQYYNIFNYENKPFNIKLRNVYELHLFRNMIYDLVEWAIKDWNHWFIKLFLRPMEGGEKAFLMAKDHELDRPHHHVCNVINKNIIPSLPENCIVEVPCYFRNGTLYPVEIGSFPKAISDLIKVHAKNQQLVVDAALKGDLDLLLKVMKNDPMCQFIQDDEKIEQLTHNMLYYQREWLPIFKDAILPSNKITTLKYYVDKIELFDLKLAKRKKYLPSSNQDVTN